MAIGSGAAVNIDGQIPVWVPAFHFGGYIYLKLELRGHVIILLLIFWGTAVVFSIVAAPFYFLPTVRESSSFSTYLLTLIILCSFYSNHPYGCAVSSHCGFDLHFRNLKLWKCSKEGIWGVCLYQAPVDTGRSFRSWWGWVVAWIAWWLRSSEKRVDSGLRDRLDDTLSVFEEVKGTAGAVNTGPGSLAWRTGLRIGWGWEFLVHHPPPQLSVHERYTTLISFRAFFITAPILLGWLVMLFTSPLCSAQVSKPAPLWQARCVPS